LNKDDAQKMTEILRSGVVEAGSSPYPAPLNVMKLGHKGQPLVVKKQHRTGAEID